ncbi:MAG: isoaspartyl peptidase/L-asparaginase [Armatimonadetes bacterium]|nr:isoaspartyl peptidase/L-asparaginase [Armatimonadota bacterium]
MALQMAIITHGGAGAVQGWVDGCEKAACKGMEVLEKSGDAMDAAVRAVTVLEDDGRYNAGSGSVLRLDGKTIEMDASVMDSRGRLGGVAILRDVKNPVQVARGVVDTPHILLAGEGAFLFAQHVKAEKHPGPSEQATKRYEEMKKAILQHQGKLPGRFDRYNLSDIWNFPEALREVFSSCDTVGAVCLDRKGNFAVANSTGGSSPMLLGRIGDSPLLGCGFYAGPKGAVASTGIGEEIIKTLLSKVVYDHMASGIHPQAACERGVALFPKEITIGVIAVSRDGFGRAYNRTMPTGVKFKENGAK